MFKEIVSKYEKFSDSLILELNYKSTYENRTVELLIKCMNGQNDYKWDIIKLFFFDVLIFRFVENDKTSSTFINSALIKQEKELITFDFFPLIFDNSRLEENVSSDFIIKCKKVSYEVTEES